MRFFCLAVLIISCYPTLSASDIDTSQLRIQYEQALQWNEARQTKKASGLAERTLERYQKEAAFPPDIQSGLYNILGDCALEMGLFAEALKRYQEATDLLQGKGLAEGLLMAEVFHKLGNYYQETKQFSQAETYLEKALVIRKEKLGSWHTKVADTYINLGICRQFSGDFDKALDFHQQALAIRLDLIPDEAPQIAQCYNNIGLCYDDQQNYAASKAAYQSALSRYLLAYPENHPDVADVYLNLGNVHGLEGQLDTFILYQTKALQIWQFLYQERHPLIALAYNNLANAYDEKGNSQRAFQLFQKALSLRKDIYGDQHPDVAATHFNIGLFHFWSSEWELADQAFQASFVALNYQTGPKPAFEKVNDPILLLRLLQFVPELPKQHYREQGAISFLLEAANYYEQADLLIDYLRTRYEAIASKLLLATSAQDIYDDAIEVALILAELTGDNQYVHQAFQFSEKSKGVLLLEALKQSDAATFSGIPNEILTEINQLDSIIGDLEKQQFLLTENNTQNQRSAIDSINTLLFKQKEVRTGIIKRLEEDYPQYFNLRYATSTIPVEWLQSNLLTDDQTIIEYFLGKTKLSIFIINQDSFQVRRVNLPANFRVAIQSFNRSIRSFPFVSSNDLLPTIEQYASSAHYLYQHLIEPIADLIQQKIIIIPDEELGFISFEALLSKVPTQLSLFKGYPYLVKDYTISYNYSTGLLKEMMSQGNKQGLKPYLGFSPQFSSDNTKGLAQLRYNEAEVQGVQKNMGGTILSGPMASKEHFIKRQARYKVLHLATHGKANNASGDYSFLAFSETPNAIGDDALLYVREIYNLSTHAQLVVLSACETGTGELQKGEGVASIARSFSYAGAESLVASHWSVDDKATSQLMHGFFAFIKEGYAKDEALREAKLQFIQTSKHKDVHPFFWASFVPIGNMESIDLGSPWGLYLASILGLLALATGIFFVYRYSQHHR